MKRVIIEGFVLAAIACGIAYAQDIFPSSYPNASALTGPEQFLANQNGQTVVATANQIKTFTGSGGGGGGGCTPCVSTFNGRTGTVSLQSSDVTNALTYTPLSPANNLSDILNAATGRTNLGLGAAATQAVGTTGGVLGLLNTNNVYSGTSTFSGTTISSRRTVNSSATLSASTDNFVCGDVSGGSITLTLPPNTLANGTTLAIDDCKRQSNTHPLTVAANLGQTISGSATIVINTNGGAILAIWNSTDNDWNLF